MTRKILLALPDGTSEIALSGGQVDPTATREQRNAARTGYQLKSFSGLGLAPVDVQFKASAFSGSRHLGTRIKNRVIDLVFEVYGSDPEQFQLRMMAIEAVLGEQTLLTVEDSLGQRRTILCRYTGGDDRASSAYRGTDTRQRMSITMEAEDPFFRSGEVISKRIPQTAAKAWIPFGPPLEVAASSSNSLLSLNNAGDVEAFPVWSIVGPGGPVIIYSETLGVGFMLETTLAPGEERTVDTDPRSESYGVWEGTEDRTSELSLSSTLWAIPPGMSNATITIGNATAASDIRFVADLRWRSGMGIRR